MKVTLDGALQAPASSELSSASHTPKAQAPDPKVLHAAREFEAVFLRQMLSAMQKTTKSAMGGGTGSDTYASFATDSLADSLAQSGGIGLADAIVKAMGPAAFRPPSEGEPK